MTLQEPAISFRVLEHDEPGLEVRVNFGVFSGRNATPAEVDGLAEALRSRLPAFTIVAEERHEFGPGVETSLHQVVVEVAREHVGDQPELLGEQIVLAANGWALDCIASRHGGGELEPQP
jgi:hypothetical protein